MDNNLVLMTTLHRFGREANAKEAAIHILSKEWPLSLKEIYFAVVREYALNVSYQAVHKALKQLTESKVLVKQERRYWLNIEWIRQLKAFSQSLEKAYSKPIEEAPLRLKDLEKIHGTRSTQGLKKSQPREYKPTKIGILGKKEGGWHGSGRSPLDV